jgi:hypothetical protein
MISAAVREPLAPTLREVLIQEEKEATVPVTRLPAKEAPRQRVSRDVAKRQTALTRDVPSGPIAVPRNNSRESVARSESGPRAIAPSASAFGEAIARGLATATAGQTLA